MDKSLIKGDLSSVRSPYPWDIVAAVCTDLESALDIGKVGPISLPVRHYHIQGMTCAGDTSRVEERLNRFPGVFWAAANFGKAAATVWFEENAAEAHEIDAHLMPVGCRVGKVEELPDDDPLRVDPSAVVAHPMVDAYIRFCGRNEHIVEAVDDSYRHATVVARTTAEILRGLSFSPGLQQLGLISGYLHDIGKAANPSNHASTGACLTGTLLSQLGMRADAVAMILTAIGNHAEGVGAPVSPLSAALIIADRTDVHRSRVSPQPTRLFDVCDRINRAAVRTSLQIDQRAGIISFKVSVDPKVATATEYSDLFARRASMCRGAADYLHSSFDLLITEIN